MAAQRLHSFVTGKPQGCGSVLPLKSFDCRGARWPAIHWDRRQWRRGGFHFARCTL